MSANPAPNTPFQSSSPPKKSTSAFTAPISPPTTRLSAHAIASPSPLPNLEPDPKPTDLWSQIDDFKWLKPTPSPNWSLLPPEDTISDDVWTKVIPGGPSLSLEDILRAVRVLK